MSLFSRLFAIIEFRIVNTQMLYIGRQYIFKSPNLCVRDHPVVFEKHTAGIPMVPINRSEGMQCSP